MENTRTCMALNCTNVVTQDVEVPLGGGGAVILELCADCRPFFEEKKEEAESLHAHPPAHRSTSEALTYRGEQR